MQSSSKRLLCDSRVPSNSKNCCTLAFQSRKLDPSNEENGMCALSASKIRMQIILWYILVGCLKGCKCCREAFNGLLHQLQIMLNRFLMIREILFIRVHPRFRFFCGHHFTQQTDTNCYTWANMNFSFLTDYVLTEYPMLPTQNIHTSKEDRRRYRKTGELLIIPQKHPTNLYNSNFELNKIIKLCFSCHFNCYYITWVQRSVCEK